MVSPEGERTKVRGRTIEHPPHPNLLPQQRGRRDIAGVFVRTLNTSILSNIHKAFFVRSSRLFGADNDCN